MIEKLLEQVVDANIWLVLLGVLGVIVGSSALTMWIQKLAESREQGKIFKRSARSGALDAAGIAYVEYMRYQTSDDPEKDIVIATTQAKVYGEIARAGDTKLLDKARAFIQIAERYAAADPETSAEAYDAAFDSLIDEIVRSTPS
ncbi:hypothetical protein MUN78_16650 [Leucobacter allii]|uniref:Uncharacterized protein n=1 Tax=Leucobacter allii TaxID=2932247 RepID=A0ABY4FLZ4_9MICO|nr:hypothetical protein [Leucobacter allii]UOQ57261.1 hypothetical protein MUN78_16650 [Leucobacter allii]